MKATKMRRALTRCLRVAKRTLARDDKDETEHAEAIHGARVSARRLREYCRITKQRDLARDLTWLIRKLGALRDLDVARAMQHSKSKTLWLASEMRQQSRRALATLRSKRTRHLLAALRDLPSLPIRKTKKHIQRLEEKVRSGTGNLHRVEEVHAFRRAVRRLRYCREWLGQDARSLARLQTSMGLVIDLAMAVDQAKGFLASNPRDRAAATRCLRSREVELGRTLHLLSLEGVCV